MRSILCLRAAIVAIAVATIAIPIRCFADTESSDAAALSNAAFTLLNSIDTDSKAAGPMLAPVASLASDAQALTSALDKGDSTAASHAMAAIIQDRDRIDAARAASGKADLPGWSSIQGKIAALRTQITPVAGPSIAAALPPGPSGPPEGPPPEAANPPQVVINSRAFTGGAVRVRGFLAGTNLKSAGIYDGAAPLKMIQVSDVVGDQRVNFDFTIQDPTATQVIQVTDALGRIARAPVAPDVGALTHSRDGHEKMIELGATTAAETDLLASRGPVTASVSHANTEVIPRADGSEDATGAPGRRIPGGVAGPLSNVQINVIGVMPSPSQPGAYEVIGQINGPGVHRAGVYVNGRLAQPIPINAGAYNSFDVTFQMPAGQQASIRAYGAGNNFTEASIDASNNGFGTAEEPGLVVPGVNPYYAYRNPYGVPVYPSPGYPPGYGYPPRYGYPAPYGYPPGYAPPGSPTPWYRHLIP